MHQQGRLLLRRPRSPSEPVDKDARAAHRSAGATESNIYVGYEAHVVTDVPAKPGAGPVPHIARAVHLVRAGYHRGVAGLIAVLVAGELPQPREVICDRAYNWTRAVLFSLPLLRCGYTPIVDLHSKQYGVHPGPIEGTIWIDGTLYTECLPQRLRRIQRLTRDLDAEDKVRA